MTTRFAEVGDLAALDALFTASADGPVVLFKHDPVCSISANAYQELSRLGARSRSSTSKGRRGSPRRWRPAPVWNTSHRR